MYNDGGLIFSKFKIKFFKGRRLWHLFFEVKARQGSCILSQ